MRILQSFIVFMLIGLGVSAQTVNNMWTSLSQNQAALAPSEEQGPQPKQFFAFSLKVDQMAAQLALAPMEFTQAAQTQALTLELPGADGFLRAFRIAESPVMAPGLMAKYPNIRTYSGQALDGTGDVVRLDMSPQGFHAFVFKTAGPVEIIQPALNAQANGQYLVYRLNDLPNQGGAVQCGVSEEPIRDAHNSMDFWASRVTDRDATPVQLRKYRIAIAASGEYSQLAGGTVPSVLSSIVTALNFIVAIMERDFDVRMELIANNDVLIFLDPNTDPYTGDLTDWIGDNHVMLNSTIGTANFDIGHMFGKLVPASPLAGLAGGRVCNAINKGAGGSSGNPIATPQFFLVAAHEMCHQMSGSHTWNNCTQDIITQRAPDSAYEPGSGSTIMSYAGSCLNNDVVGNNDNERYFHIESIEQVQSFVFTESGANCGVLETTTNNLPSVDIPLQNGFYIPISTPFQLSGTGSDPDNDVLTYCWEQHDKGPIVALGQASGTSPLFRSFLPSTNPKRIFPRMTLLIANQSSISELLPTYSRSLSFRLTVRDNHAGAGGVASEEVQFFSTDQAGPFVITYPGASGIVWPIGSYQTIIWDVANTDKAPVNCQLVNIKMSTDGGQTYPFTLASGVPNNGRACIQVPNNISSTIRIMVEAADNIFFDISNQNLTINQPTQAGISLCASASTATACLPDVFSTTISTSALQGFNQPITLSASGLPAGVTATFSPNPVNPGNSSTLTLAFQGALAENVYTIDVTGTAGSASATSSILLTTVNNDFSAFSLVSPANGANGVELAPQLTWTPVSDADQYEVQVATNPSFAAGVLVANANAGLTSVFTIPGILPEGATFYWRVRPINACNNAPWSDPYVFITKVQSCATFTATDVPKIISANGTPTVESKITVSNTGVLSDVNVKVVSGNHAFFKNLEVRLLSPAGTNVLLVKDKCPVSVTFNMGFDDSGSTFACPPPNNGTTRKPEELLSQMSGQSMTGVWTLRIKDNNSGDGGTLTGFQLELCSSSSSSGPVIINNNPLVLTSGVNAAILTNLLLTQDANNTADQLTYTLMTIPANGELRWNGTILKVGDQFKQSNLDNGDIRFYDYGLNVGNDDFTFAVTDGEGGMASGTFLIQPMASSTNSPERLRSFVLAPNPATNQVQISFSTPLESDASIRIYNMAGQELQHRIMPNGTQTIQIQLSDLPPGVYSVSVQDTTGIGIKKLVIR